MHEGQDGRVPYERLKGKQCREEYLEIGESVFYKIYRGQRGKWRPIWEPGVWLGKRWGTIEHVVAREDGSICRARTVQRRPLADRWQKEAIERIRQFPWEAEPLGQEEYELHDRLARSPEGLGDEEAEELLASAVKRMVSREVQVTGYKTERVRGKLKRWKLGGNAMVTAERACARLEQAFR